MNYTIGTLAGLTGLSPHTIRAWERRYKALSPGRTNTNRRVYEDRDVDRLKLLKKIVESGHSIGHVAKLTTEQLRALENSTEAEEGQAGSRPAFEVPDSYLASCQLAVNRLDAEGLEEGLVRGAAALGILGLLDSVVTPLLAEIEVRWLDGSLRISQEHMASAVLRTFLDRVRTSMPGLPASPRLLVTTPRLQMHEIGALMVAIVAAIEGWSVTYLGPNLPAEDIALAARQCGAGAIGLSLVFPLDDHELPDELRLLREMLGPSMPIVAGGRGAGSYNEALEEIGAHVIQTLKDFRELLIEFRLGHAVHGKSRIRPLTHT